MADLRPRPPGSIPAILLVALLLLVTLAGIAAAVMPAATCPKCLGRGLHRMVDPETRPILRGVTFQPALCDYCSDRKEVSLFKCWRWHPEDAPVPPVYRN
jgi:hypothetical protein